MENPQRLADDADDMQRLAEEQMEEMLMAQEEDQEEEEEDDMLLNEDDNVELEEDYDNDDENSILQDGDLVDENHGMFIFDEDEDDFVDEERHNHHIPFRDEEHKKAFPYVKVSLWAALLLVYYALRTRQQWYLALVFLSSSKYAFVILGNAFVALLVWAFTSTTQVFLSGLRRNEAEGLGDYFRWHITETCLALTIFRSELTVKTALLFLILVFAKCLHHIVDAREAHLRLTEEVVIANASGRMSIRLPHAKLFVLICILQLLDIWAVVLCGQNIAKNGPSVSILFAFESAILLTSVISNAMLWHLHLLDGIFQYLHEQQQQQQHNEQQEGQPPRSSFWQRWIHPWKDHKATLIFCVELQAQTARFIFYLTFFSIVFCYYGLPINLIREVYVSFLALKQRMQAFQKYRKLLSSMNRFQNPTVEELEEEHICIICRDEMTVETAKRLPGCGHIFHKSCLREWLVQQQTCPTCRGDISAMEARQKQQDVIDARIQEQQAAAEEEEEEEQVEEENKEQEEGGVETKDDEPEDSDQPPENGSESPTTEETKETPPLVEADDRKLPPVATKQSSISTPAQDPPAFPAFYRVVRDASVFRNQRDSAVYVVTRIIPPGVVVLATDMDYRTCVLQKKMMIRIPDGWISEDEVTRIMAVPLDSLQQQ